MCGIAGILHLDGGEASARRLESMIGQVRHRGPDAAAVFVDRGLGLAHARLSIIDLENGTQPMKTGDGSLVISFNGEIFNYVELRRTLIECGHQFRTSSDTEVILHAYAEYGERCVEHFNGQWAFAIWDRRRQKLFLSRDRLGIRPLFYTQAANRFFFASEIKSLFINPEIHREIDVDGLSQVFTFWSTLSPTTIFRDIAELPPGHNLVVENGSIRTDTYWQLDFTEVDRSTTADQWCEQLRALLEDATRLRLRADVPVGAYLSGGLDSSLTAALAQQVTGDRLKTFSVTFEDREFDESPHQRTVVDHLGVEHHALCCSNADIARVFPNVVWHAERPVLRTAPAPLHILAELVHASGFKVVLTGEGADEMLGGYDLFKEAKVRRFFARDPESAYRASLFGKLYPYLPNLQTQSVAMRQAFFKVKPKDLASPFFSHLPRWEMTTQLRRFLSPDLGAIDPVTKVYEELEASLPAAYNQWDPFLRAQYLEATILMPGYILSSQGDRAAMAHSVEGRFPFLDHRIAELAARVPPRLKMKGLNEKYLLKRAMADLLPDSITQRTKQPYRAPDARSFYSENWQSAREDYVTELLTPARVRSAGLFRPEAVERLLAKVQSGRATGARDNMALVGILSTQLLVEQFVDSFSRSGCSCAVASVAADSCDPGVPIA